MTDEYIMNIYRKIPLMPFDTLIPIDQNRPDLTDLLQVIREFIYSGEPLILTNDQKWLIRIKTSQHKHFLAYQSISDSGMMPDEWKRTLKGNEWSEIETKKGKMRVFCKEQYYEITNEHGKVVAIESKN